MEYRVFDEYAKETAQGDLFKLPKSLWLSSYSELQKFEVYLDAVAKDRKNLLALPTQFWLQRKWKKYKPEFRSKSVICWNFRSITKRTFKQKLGLKKLGIGNCRWQLGATQKTVSWACSEERCDTGREISNSWSALMIKPEKRLNAFAREAIVNSHPEWLKDSVAQATPKKMVVGIRMKGGKGPSLALTTLLNWFSC